MLSLPRRLNVSFYSESTINNRHDTARLTYVWFFMLSMVLFALTTFRPLAAQVLVNENDGFVKFTMGDYHMCGLKADGSVICSIYGPYGRFDVPSGTPPLSDISAGSTHTCGIDLDGALLCWGDDNFGQLNSPNDGRRFVSVTASKTSFHTCAITDDQQAVCWGLDTNGQSTPPDDGIGFVDVTLFYQSTCGLRTDGSVECWGGGLFDWPQRYEGPYLKFADRRVDGGCGVLASGEFSCVDSSPDYLTGTYTDAVSISTHFCGLRTDGDIDCAKTPSFNNLDVTSPESLITPGDRFTQIDKKGRRLCALRTDGEILCWGAPDSFQPPSTVINPVAVPVGLTAVAYSDVALELSWERIRGVFPTNITGYEIFRDGELLAFTENGSSYIDYTVLPGIDYQYSIRAIDGRAISSDLSAPVRINTSDRGNPVVGTYVEPVRTGEPVDLDSYLFSEDEYTDTLFIELLWIYPLNTDVVGFEIRRDTEFYAFTREDVFMDENIEVGECYHYDVIAVDESGAILGFSSIYQAASEEDVCH